MYLVSQAQSSTCVPLKSRSAGMERSFQPCLNLVVNYGEVVRVSEVVFDEK